MPLNLCVRSAQTPGTSSIGELLTFDFTEDVGKDEFILAYGVGLAGFVANYNSGEIPSYWAQKMGALTVSIVPNLVGNTLYATASVVLTDYDGDAGLDSGGYDGNPTCSVQATALALIGDSNPGGEYVLGNRVGLQQPTPVTLEASDPLFAAFVSGFSLVTDSSPGSISGLSYGLSASTESGPLLITPATSVGWSLGTTGTVDALALAAPPMESPTFQLLDAAVQWGAFDPDNPYAGITGGFWKTFDVPTGKKIVNVGVLQQSLDIRYGRNAEFQLIAAYVWNLQIKDALVEGNYTLNIFNPDYGAREYIADGSTATVYLIAQFG